jgi:NADH-quinone oxidoreductase subunit L
MTAPLATLAVFAVGLGIFGTPAWPWFASFIESKPLLFEWQGFAEPGLLPLMVLSSLIVLAGLGIGWWLYGSRPIQNPEQEDVVEHAAPTVFGWLAHRLYFDELYAATVLRWYAALAWSSGWLDRRVWGGIVNAVSEGFRGLGWVNKSVDSQWIDGGFDKGCEELVTGGGVLAWLQSGRAPGYLRALGIGVLLLVVLALVIGSATGQVRL